MLGRRSYDVLYSHRIPSSCRGACALEVSRKEFWRLQLCRDEIAARSQAEEKETCTKPNGLIHAGPQFLGRKKQLHVSSLILFAGFIQVILHVLWIIWMILNAFLNLNTRWELEGLAKKLTTTWQWQTYQLRFLRFAALYGVTLLAKRFWTSTNQTAKPCGC